VGRRGPYRLRQQVLSNVHPPASARANGPVGNVSEFYAAFGVKPSDRLSIAPGKRVRFW
jgi:predicted metalloendopeptidase